MPTVADQLEIVSGSSQANHPGEELQPFTVRVLGPRRRNLFGRKKARLPVADVPVTFEVDLNKREKELLDGNKTSARYPFPMLTDTAPGPDAATTPMRATVEARTDAAGMARVWGRLGTHSGEWEVTADIAKRGERVRFRVLSGVRRVAAREAIVDTKIPVGLEMMEWTADGDTSRGNLTPVEDRRIVFELGLATSWRAWREVQGQAQ